MSHKVNHLPYGEGGGEGFEPILTRLQVAQKHKHYLAGVVLTPSDVLLLRRDPFKPPSDASKPPPEHLQDFFKTIKNRIQIVHICKSCFYSAI